MKSQMNTTGKDIDKDTRYYPRDVAIKRIYKKIINKSHIPAKFRDATFSNFNLEKVNQKNKKKIKAIMDYGNNILDNLPHSIYMFSEYNGCGKTHLAVAILKKAAWEFSRLIFEQDPVNFSRRGNDLQELTDTPVFFMSEKNYLYKKKLAFNTDDSTILKEVELIEKMVIKARLLVIDDFLKERNTNFTFNELTSWICLRYEDNKSVIFTSNRDFMELALENNENPFYDTNNFKNATYLASRIEEMTKGFKFYFFSSLKDDYRHKNI